MQPAFPPQTAGPAIHPGTSGFAYREWRGTFYPAGLPATRMLQEYAVRLPAVEINASFYRMPQGEKLAAWGKQVPPHFRFAFKAPAIITHKLRLRSAEEPLERFLRETAALGVQRGPLLFQLPPGLACDLPLLQDFLPIITGVAAAFEFRHPSWFDDRVYRTLSDAGCALCISDRADAPPPPVAATASFGYLRLRRPDYSGDDLARWLEAVARQPWREAFIFFRHEETGSGPRFAQSLLDLLNAGKSRQ